VLRISGFVLIVAIAAVTSADPVRPEAVPQYAAPDLLFFARHLAADLHERCAGCHSDPEMAGSFSLAPLDDLERPDRTIVLRNFRQVVRFVDASNPAESKLVRNPLGESGHSEFYSVSERSYQTLLHFAMGATVDNRPPEAIVQKRYDVTVDQALQIDGTLSGDPESRDLRYHWSVRERPPGSAVSVTGGPSARFTADRPGVYRIELCVHDGTLWSLPASLIVVANAPAPSVTPPPIRKTPKKTSKASRPGPPPTKPKAFVERRLSDTRLRLVRRLFFDLKRRTPKLDEIMYWHDRTHAEMVDAFLADEETWAGWFESQLFYFLLLDQFRPREGRLTTLPARLTQRKVTVPMALQEIVRSQYFGARNPGNDTFVTVVLEQCLGLVVQERKNLRILEAGKKMYDGYKAKIFKEKGNSQATFVRICFQQRLFYDHLIRRSWKWLTGPAYVKGVEEARTKDEIPYVRGLFVDILGRTPTYQELRNVRNAFLSLADPTPIRLVMGRVLLESGQVKMPESSIAARRFVQEQFIRLLARQPNRNELDTFTDLLKNDPQVTPSVILWTLISSPEYQSY